MTFASAPLKSVSSAPMARDDVSGSASVLAPLTRAVRYALPWLSQVKATKHMGDVDRELAKDVPCL